MNKVKHISVPMDVWQAPSLNLTEIILYAEIAAFCQKDGECFLSYPYLCDELRVGKRQVQKYLSNLAKRGLIEVLPTDGRRTKVRSRCEQKFAADANYNSQQVRTPVHTEYKNINISTPNGDRYRDISKEKNTKKEKTFSFRNALVEIGVAPATADAWLQVRKTKKATNTQIAFEAVRNEIQKTGKSAEDCIRCAVVNSWAGFRASWLVKEQAGTTTTGRRENYVEAGLRVADELLGTNYMAQLNKLKNGQ
jgi:hypothetical protein